MQKVETLLPADFHVKIFAYWENESPLVECKNFRHFLKTSACAARMFYACLQ
jgi:hypothetical protein